MEIFFRRKFSHVKHIFVRQSTLSYDYVKDIFQYFSMFLFFSKKYKLNFWWFFPISGLLCIHLWYTQCVYCSSKELVWRTYVGLFTLDLALFTDVEMHLMWIVLETLKGTLTWCLASFLRFFIFLDSRVILIWQITILPISYTIKILLNLRWIILFSLQYIFQLRLEKTNYDTFTIVLCVQDLYTVYHHTIELNTKYVIQWK